MEPAKTLVVNVVTWNSARFLPHLFESIAAQTTNAFTVTVVDNASSDGTLAWLREKARGVPVLKNFRNGGFARAHNQAIAFALQRWEAEGALDRKYILVLNPDILLAPTCIAQLISFMDTHPDVDMAGPKLLRADRRTNEDGEIVDIERSSLIDSAGISLLKSRRVIDRGAGEKDSGQYDGGEPFGISGAAMLLRASVIPSIVLQNGEVFDEDFFAYKEDADLSWRFRLLGKRIAFVPGAVAWHHRTARASRGGLIEQYAIRRNRASVIMKYSRRNQLWLEWKNDDAGSRLLHFPWIAAEKIRRVCAATLFPSSAVPALFEAWAGFGRMRRKRKELLTRRRLSPGQIRALFS